MRLLVIKKFIFITLFIGINLSATGSRTLPRVSSTETTCTRFVNNLYQVQGQFVPGSGTIYAKFMDYL